MKRFCVIGAPPDWDAPPHCLTNLKTKILMKETKTPKSLFLLIVTDLAVIAVDGLNNNIVKTVNDA